MGTGQITFFLVRHGEAETNSRGIISSYPEVRDFHLTEKGRMQIARVGELLSSQEVHALIASPLLRTQESAVIISQVINLPVFTDIRLRETDFGLYNGKSALSFFSRYPHPSMRIKTSGTDGVESFMSMRERVQSFLEDVSREYMEKKVVVVSHGDTLEQLRGVIEGKGLRKTALGWMPEKGSCTEV